MKSRHAIFRARRIDINDYRPAMLRLLMDGRCNVPDKIVVNYHEQWATINKAQRLGYLDAEQILTDAGRSYIEKNAPKYAAKTP